MGYDDGSKTIKYYNPKTRKVLTSRNFRFLSLTNEETPPEPIAISPNTQLEGESEGNTQPKLGDKSVNLKRKQSEEELLGQPEQKRCTQGIHIDYRYLHNPLPDEEDEANKAELPSDEELFAIIASDQITNLNKAKLSIDWLQWEQAIQAELTQLQQTGTWRLVTKLPDAVPIAKKWVFNKKRDCYDFDRFRLYSHDRIQSVSDNAQASVQGAS